MTHSLRVAAVIGLYGAVLSPGAIWAKDPVDSSDLSAEVQNLRKQVDALQNQVDQQASHPTATVAELPGGPTADSPLTSFSAGWKNDKFVIQSTDGRFSLSPIVQIQLRNTTNVRDNSASDGWTTENGFELRRAKIGFGGNVYSKALTYQVLFDNHRNSGDTALQFAWIKYQINPTWAVEAGQFKDPLGKEQLISGTKQLAAERSLLSDLLIGGDDPVQGVGAIYTSPNDRFRLETAFTDGSGQYNTNFRDISGTNPDTRPDWGVAARAELQLIGEKFKDNGDFTANKQADTLLVIGAGGDLTQTGDSNLATYTADVLFKTPRGFGAFASVIGRTQTQFNAGTSVLPDYVDVNDLGFLVQASQTIGRWAKADWELFARYDLIQLDSARVADPYDNNVQEITLGTNAYFRGQNLKATVDVSYLPNGSPVNSDGNGVLQSDDSQFVVRAQLQLAI